LATLSIKKKILFTFIVYLIIFLCGEATVRLYRGVGLTLENTQVVNRIERPRFTTDSFLGWKNRPGSTTGVATDSEGIVLIDNNGFRNNGNGMGKMSSSILTIGGSTTFGDEVKDNESWPSQLEALIGQRVLNAGASGYGMDQAVLSAESVLQHTKVDWVILTFVPDSVFRTEYSVRWGLPKPLFYFTDDSMALKPPYIPSKLWERIRGILGYSHFIDFLMDIIAPRMGIPWNPKYDLHEHENGPDVANKLIERLVNIADSVGAKPLIVYIHYPPHPAVHPLMFHSNKLDSLIKNIKKSGIPFIDVGKMLSITFAEHPEKRESFFMPNWHFSLKANQWLANQIMKELAEKNP
jgi:hypothetical protein